MFEQVISIIMIIPIIVFIFDFWLTFLVSVFKGKFQIPKTVYLNPEKFQKKKGEVIEVNKISKTE